MIYICLFCSLCSIVCDVCCLDLLFFPAIVIAPIDLTCVSFPGIVNPAPDPHLCHFILAALVYKLAHIHCLLCPTSLYFDFASYLFPVYQSVYCILMTAASGFLELVYRLEICTSAPLLPVALWSPQYLTITIDLLLLL